MANLREENKWEEGIYQLEVTDPVVGGIDGISNKQAKQLANRTKFLKESITTLNDGKLDKSAKATDSDKLDGLDSSAFVQIHGLLPNGDADLPSYWSGLQRGTYYYNAKQRTVANMPAGVTHAHVDLRVIESEISISCYTYDGAIYVRSGIPATMRPWVRVVMGTAASDPDGDTVVARDANGDFAGRYISAEYFKMTAPAQDDGFSENFHIIYRANDGDNGYLRSVRFSKLSSLLGRIGVNQTLYGLKEQRLSNTIYENTTDKPIYVSVAARASLQGGTVAIQLFINDTLVSETFCGNIQDNIPIGTVCGIVPVGARYKVVLTNVKGLPYIHSWSELR